MCPNDHRMSKIDYKCFDLKTIEFVLDKKKWKENRKTTCICIRNTKKNPYGHIDGFFMNCLGRGFSSSSNCCMEETTLRDTNFLTNDENAAPDQLGTCKRRSNYSEKLVSHFFLVRNDLFSMA